MTDYNMYTPQQSTQNYGVSQGYGNSTSGNDGYATQSAPIQTKRKGRCPTNGKCTVCTRLCMMD